MVDARNSLDSAIHNAQSSLSEHGSKISQEIRDEVTRAVDSAKALRTSDNLEAINEELKKLNEAAFKLGQAVYSQSQTSNNQGQQSGQQTEQQGEQTTEDANNDKDKKN